MGKNKNNKKGQLLKVKVNSGHDQATLSDPRDCDENLKSSTTTTTSSFLRRSSTPNNDTDRDREAKSTTTSSIEHDVGQFLRQCSLSTISSASSSISWAEDAMESEFTNKLAQLWNQIEEVCGASEEEEPDGQICPPPKDVVPVSVYNECLLWRKAFPNSPLVQFKNTTTNDQSNSKQQKRPTKLILNLTDHSSAESELFTTSRKKVDLCPLTPLLSPPKTPESIYDDYDEGDQTNQDCCLTPNPNTSSEYVNAWLNGCKANNDNDDGTDTDQNEPEEIDEVFDFKMINKNLTISGGSGDTNACGGSRPRPRSLSRRVRQLSLPFLDPNDISSSSSGDYHQDHEDEDLYKYYNQESDYTEKRHEENDHENKELGANAQTNRNRLYVPNCFSTTNNGNKKTIINNTNYTNANTTTNTTTTTSIASRNKSSHLNYNNFREIYTRGSSPSILDLDKRIRRPSAASSTWSRYSPPDSPSFVSSFFSLPTPTSNATTTATPTNATSISFPQFQSRKDNNINDRIIPSYFEKLRAGQEGIKNHFIEGRESPAAALNTNTPTSSSWGLSKTRQNVEIYKRPRGAHLPSILQELKIPTTNVMKLKPLKSHEPNKAIVQVGGDKVIKIRRKSDSSTPQWLQQQQQSNKKKGSKINKKEKESLNECHCSQQESPSKPKPLEKTQLTPFLFWLLDKVAI